ncbi:hypothetical protein PVAG01_05575 [Phlyctema vagabunda]|uniref:Uncharacterized protein n=1 Tax=Phlyctema vagabunda TaxID=108571 RepID=A0ABR4PKG3_9HELO
MLSGTTGRFFFTAALLSVAECAPAPALVEERGVCNADNLLRLLRTPANLAETLPFCSSYLKKQASTVVVNTVTLTATSYETILFTVFPTQTSYTTTVSSIEPTQSSSTTEVSTRTSTFTEVSSVTTITTVSTDAIQPVRRAASKTPLSQQITESYSPSRISSACDCLTIPVSIASVTSTAAVATTVVQLQSTQTAPEVTTVITVSSTTTLPEVTQIVTVQATSDVSVTTTLVSVVTSTSSVLTGPSQTPGFFVRSYRPSDNFYSGNYLVNRNFNTANQNQALYILGRNTTAPRFDLTAEGYLVIVKSTIATAAATGTEDQKWIAFYHTDVASETLFFDKLANVQACANCQALTFTKTTDSTGTFLIPTDSTRSYQICGTTSAVPFNGLWTSKTNPIRSTCFQEQLVVVKEGVKNPFVINGVQY